MVTKPLTEAQLLEKIRCIDKHIQGLENLKKKYLSDLRYFEDPEYRKNETIYREQCTKTTLDSQEEV